MNATKHSPTAQYFPRLPLFIKAEIRSLRSGMSADQVLLALKMSEHNLRVWDNIGSTNVVESKFQLGILWTLTLSERMKTMPVRITGQWEDVIWKIIDLAKHWKPDSKLNFGSLGYTSLRPWILTMFIDPALCPNPHLRLEMLRFVGMWPKTYLRDVTSGKQAASGLVSTSAYMTLDHLIPGSSQMNLFYSLIRVLESLNRWGHIDAVAAAAVDQVSGLQVGPEASFFNHLMHLLKKKAEATQAGYQADSVYYTERYILSMFKELMHLYRMLVLTTPTAYGAPGLAQVAADFLVTITASITTMFPRYSSNMHTISSVFADIDDIYQQLFAQEKFTYFCQVLKLDHAQRLSVLGKQAHFGFLHHLLVTCEASRKEVPEEFIDSVTRAVMEAPVLLHSSKMVIDESTLIRLLLESPSDPFTRRPLLPGAYSRLPCLQADILAWRNTPGVLPR